MRKVVVVGSGLAGLSCAMRLAKKNIFVYLVSLTPARRSHSVCAQGGINAAISSDDSPIFHAYETIKGGDFLADQPPVVEMCFSAPFILKMLDQIGCLFNRTEDGSIDFRSFGGSLYKRTAYCDATTGQQLIHSLDEQVRRYEEKNLVKRYEHHEFLRLIKDEKNRAKGAVVQDINDLRIFTLPSDAVVIATGGIGMLFGRSTNSYACTSSVNAALFLQGMKLANPEFVQIHPTAILGRDKLRVVSEAVRGEGGRIWVYGNETKEIEFPDLTKRKCGEKNKPWYFLEEMYPEYKNLVPRDIAAREILKVCELGLGIDNENQVYLDVRHLPKDILKKLASPLDIYKKFTSEDPEKVPMKIFLAVHYSMGGAWVDWPAADDPDRNKRFRQMTNIEGLFNIGESDFEFHGANRLGANALLSCIFSGLTAANEIDRYFQMNRLENKKINFDLQKEEALKKSLLDKTGNENVFNLYDEMSDLMLKNVTVRKKNSDLVQTIKKLKEIEKRYQNIYLDDKTTSLNQTYLFARQFPLMLKMALVITEASLQRNESRGCHFKEFLNRDDANFLKTTIATYDEDKDDVIISYRKVDTRHFDPAQRSYDKKQEIPKIKNFTNFEPVL